MTSSPFGALLNDMSFDDENSDGEMGGGGGEDAQSPFVAPEAPAEPAPAKTPTKRAPKRKSAESDADEGGSAPAPAPAAGTGKAKAPASAGTGKTKAPASAGTGKPKAPASAGNGKDKEPKSKAPPAKKSKAAPADDAADAAGAPDAGAKAKIKHKKRRVHGVKAIKNSLKEQASAKPFIQRTAAHRITKEVSRATVARHVANNDPLPQGYENHRTMSAAVTVTANAATRFMFRLTNLSVLLAKKSGHRTLMLSDAECALLLMTHPNTLDLTVEEASKFSKGPAGAEQPDYAEIKKLLERECSSPADDDDDDE
jgi:histone H3/H4